MKKHPASFPFYTFDNLDRFGEVRHFVTSCCKGELTDVNLRSPLGPQNRIRLAQSVGFDIGKLVTGEQTHSLNIAVVTEKEAGLGNLDIDSRIPCTDALITNVKGICLMVLTADCVPVLLFDSKTQSVAAIHSGWRGTANGIVSLTVKKMKSVFGTNPADLAASVGPCIGTCCFEVGDDVAEQFTHLPETIIRKPEWIRPHVDMARAIQMQLLNSGVKNGNIEISGTCTKCNPQEFFSHRFNNTLGRIGTGILIA